MHAAQRRKDLQLSAFLSPFLPLSLFLEARYHPPMRLTLVLLLVLSACSGPAPTPPAPPPPSLEMMVKHLASDDLAGRMTGSDGERKAADYIQASWPKSITPILPDGFRQTFEFKMHGSEKATGTNVAGCIQGTDRPYDLVVIGAHYDHLGKGHPGADDNASGTAVLVDLAHRFAKKPAKRTVVFAHFSGEELGIIGSKAFVAALPPKYSTVAMLNMDMVGRVRDGKLIVLGSDTSAEWPELLTSANSGLALTFAKGGIGPSDHTAFYMKEIPVLHFFSGAHLDYHKGTDTAEKLNYDGMAKVADLVEGVARRVADGDRRLTFKKSDADFVPKEGDTPKPGARPTLGAMPDYADQDVMKIGDVIPGGPAEKAGLKAGDIIVEFDGRAVKGLQDYTEILFARKPGDEVTLKIRRGTETLTVKAVLGARQQ